MILSGGIKLSGKLEDKEEKAHMIDFLKNIVVQYTDRYNKKFTYIHIEVQLMYISTMSVPALTIFWGNLKNSLPERCKNLPLA